MKKALIVIFVLVLLIPLPSYATDGGTVHFQAILYSLTNYHSLPLDESDNFYTGIEIKILGLTVFNNASYGK